MNCERMQNVTGLLVCLLLLAGLLSCAPSPSRTDPRAFKNRPQPSVSAIGLEKQIHELVNKERQKNGVAPLAWEDALASVARNYSKDMSKRNFFDHYSPEGHDYLKRYQQAGYQCAIRTNRTIHMGGENIALNHLYDSVTTVNSQAYYDWNSQEKIADTTVRGWMKSPGHRNNILTPYFQREGIGVFIDSAGKVYITQNFC